MNESDATLAVITCCCLLTQTWNDTMRLDWKAAEVRALNAFKTQTHRSFFQTAAILSVVLSLPPG